MLIAVLLLHLAAGSLMLRESRRLPVAGTPGRSELRLLPIQRPPQPAAAAAAPRAMQARPRAVPGRNAISLPALPSIAIDTEAATSPTASQPSPAASAPAPLDLRLPARVGAPPAPSLAEQIRADGRANSPRESLEQRLAGSLGAAMGNGKIEVIEGVQGGRMIRGAKGECTLIRPSMMQEVDPSNERWRQMPSKSSDCSQLQPGARRHRRPP